MKKSKLTIGLQFLITILVIVFLIMYIVTKKYIIVLEYLLGIDLLVMGYNNKIIYKRQNYTIYYLVFGIGMIVFATLSLLGVI